ncbi:hypothetical protein RS3R6_28370 [Pseudomonas atacamensis]|uniref:Uncharacterized protein n=1 Tax=Pseudomonas atacamensis TaxID=2565368 RepID=A0ABQ5PSB3_9PSED|nr:hypothetical protein RS3R1_52890 [Pseudomonas atacamensis]GLH54655.1 hypothetical protein RS3R6_28370 [Pseudomonas atacamensis]
MINQHGFCGAQKIREQARSHNGSASDTNPVGASLLANETTRFQITPEQQPARRTRNGSASPARPTLSDAV